MERLWCVHSSDFLPVLIACGRWTAGMRSFSQSEQTRFYRCLRVSAHGAVLDAVKAFTGKGLQEKTARFCFCDAARLQIEDRILFHLTDGGAVRTLYVVGVDFKLRLGVNLRVIAEQQVPVGLLGVGLLRIFVDDDTPVEDTVRLLVENAVVKLTAGAVRFRVLDQHVVVEVLMAAADEEPVDEALAALARQYGMHIV